MVVMIDDVGKGPSNGENCLLFVIGFTRCLV